MSLSKLEQESGGTASNEGKNFGKCVENVQRSAKYFLEEAGGYLFDNVMSKPIWSDFKN